MLMPPTLYAVGESGAPRVVQSLPATFDAKDIRVEKRFATSKDGTKVPYFLVRKQGATGPVPALVHAYGGFRAAQTPGYLTGQPYRAGPLGLFWVEDGNAYVLANIRGGGEYGPAWHQAALREKRQNSFDDFHAVAEDLIASGVTAKGKIAASGRSNGGVLVGAMLNQRPDLYSAAIVLYEMWCGIKKSARPRENEAALAAFLALDVAPWSFEADDAAEAGDIRAAMEREGTSIGAYDVLVAAQARRRGALLVTANRRELVRVPGLRTEDWAT